MYTLHLGHTVVDSQSMVNQILTMFCDRSLLPKVLYFFPAFWPSQKVSISRTINKHQDKHFACSFFAATIAEVSRSRIRMPWNDFYAIVFPTCHYPLLGVIIA